MNSNQLVVNRDLFEAIIEALDVPRNRFGKLDGDLRSADRLRQWAVKLDIGGASDRVDQAVKVMRAVMALQPYQTEVR